MKIHYSSSISMIQTNGCDLHGFKTHMDQISYELKLSRSQSSK